MGRVFQRYHLVFIEFPKGKPPERERHLVYSQSYRLMWASTERPDRAIRGKAALAGVGAALENRLDEPGQAETRLGSHSFTSTNVPNGFQSRASSASLSITFIHLSFLLHIAKKIIDVRDIGNWNAIVLNGRKQQRAREN